MVYLAYDDIIDQINKDDGIQNFIANISNGEYLDTMDNKITWKDIRDYINYNNKIEDFMAYILVPGSLIYKQNFEYIGNDNEYIVLHDVNGFVNVVIETGKEFKKKEGLPFEREKLIPKEPEYPTLKFDSIDDAIEFLKIRDQQDHTIFSLEIAPLNIKYLGSIKTLTRYLNKLKEKKPLYKNPLFYLILAGVIFVILGLTVLSVGLVYVLIALYFKKKGGANTPLYGFGWPVYLIKDLINKNKK